jgi:uncharacterized damage-inducible protein DinB
MQLLDEMLEAWRYTREGLIAEIENLPDARLTEKPTGLGRSALDLANHIIESGRLMTELTRADGDFKRKPFLELMAEYGRPDEVATSKSEAIEILRRSFEDIVAKMRAAGPDVMMQPITQFNGTPAPRLVWFHHGIAHEEYHRGQLAVYARLFGEVPALTKLYG